MINLLPPQEKLLLRQEKNKRMAIVISTECMVGLLCLALVLLALKFYLLAQLGSQRSVLSEVKNHYQTDEFLQYKSVISKANIAMERASRFYKNQFSMSGAVKALLGAERPSGLRFSSLRIDDVSGQNTVKVSLEGFSGTRESLVAFKENMQKNPLFLNVNFPPESWVKPTAIPFNVTFEFKK